MNHDEINALAWELMEDQHLPLAVALDKAARIYGELQAYASGYEAGQRAAMYEIYAYAAVWDIRSAQAGNPATAATIAI